ncbi:MAG: XRE family transcriptional regulator, partial [Clostridiales bacterium]|nr:XRE family transcriptional regulator [Clostridiales bacterium]
QLRIKINLTQEELANRAELSKGFISQLERDLTSPSIATLVDILECLGTNLKDFFNETDDDKIVFQKEDIFIQDNEELSHSINWIIPNAQKNSMEPILIHINNGGQSSIYSAHEGEVFGYLIQGSANLHLGGRKFKVKKGESFYFKANSSYYIENSSSHITVAILVSTPPNF